MRQDSPLFALSLAVDTCVSAKLRTLCLISVTNRSNTLH